MFLRIESDEKNLSSKLRKNNLLVVDLEPTPYKVDLWNAFVDSGNYDLVVLYSSEKNWSFDAGHNYIEYPLARFPFETFHGKGAGPLFGSILRLVSLFYKQRPSMVFISGYVDPLPLITVVFCIILRTRYVLHGDVFNNYPLHGSLSFMKNCARALIRKVVFLSSAAVLVCGRRGIESALIAGCSESKIYDFPYVVDVERLRTDRPKDVPASCLGDLDSGRAVVLFSGRMIPRKGLSTLLQASAHLSDIKEWVLWLEGAGPLQSRYIDEADVLGVGDRCRFLGFCQMSLHSWLLRHSDIVVVPSMRDPWAIVVDEGMQLGKVVVTSDATGAGADRIVDGKNGLIFTAGNSLHLASCLRNVLADTQRAVELGQAARHTSRKYNPAANVQTLSAILERGHV